ncbi:MAG TPA: DNA polymerase III subunit delta [Bryobacteraceae bacterium]|nr:DNA polymerase III subunit delta [Bryobacteraceae bacterium]
MTPAQFLARIRKRSIPSAALLLGPEAYERRRIKEALLATVPENAAVEHDLTEQTLAEVVDDARALSLFAAERLIWVVNAEAALPRGRAAEEGDEAESAAGASSSGASPLAAYLKDPSPGVTLIFEATRFDFEGDDKRRQERVRKFYAPVQEVVELRRFGPREARQETDALARSAGFRLDPAAADLLVEALGADIARIGMEIEKLALYAGARVVGVDDIGALVPDARSTTIFALVASLGRRDRARSLEILYTLAREGEYLPLALAFLSSQFRMALVAREAGLKTSQQIQGYFQRLGVAMWGSRADQIQQTAAAFSAPQLERAIGLIFEADRGLRDARPDDRIVMEQFVLKLTA